LEEADRLAERIAVIDHGRLIAEGTPAELKARLGSTVVEIGLPTEGAALRAEAILGRSHDDGFERRGNVVRLETNEGPRVLMEALRALDSEGLVPSSIALREPSLDDVFLAITGRPAEPAGESGHDELVPAGGAS
jgi:ABC-2 type transport system ATP-binding protein